MDTYMHTYIQVVKAFQEGDSEDSGMDITVVIKRLAQRGITAQQVR